MKVQEVSIGWALKQPNPAAAVQRAIDNVKNWGAKKAASSELCNILGVPLLFSGIAPYVWMAVTALLVVCGVAEWLEGGAA